MGQVKMDGSTCGQVAEVEVAEQLVLGQYAVAIAGGKERVWYGSHTSRKRHCRAGAINHRERLPADQGGCRKGGTCQHQSEFSHL
jgi:hypothetical protein